MSLDDRATCARVAALCGDDPATRRDAAAREAVAAHLAACAACRDAFAPDLALWAAVAVAPPPAAILPLARRRRPTPAARRLAAAAALVVVFVAAWRAVDLFDAAKPDRAQPAAEPAAVSREPAKVLLRDRRRAAPGDASPATTLALDPPVFVQSFTVVRLGGGDPEIRSVSRISRPVVAAAR